MQIVLIPAIVQKYDKGTRGQLTSTEITSYSYMDDKKF